MLVAKDNLNLRRVAEETLKVDKPFFCPECDEEVILKKEEIVCHHYAYKPGNSCSYGGGKVNGICRLK